VIVSIPKPTRAWLEHCREWIRWHPCCVCWPSVPPGDRTQLRFGARQSEACHVEGRGAGGDDWANLIPMCHWHHIMIQHCRGWNEVWPERHPTDGREHALALAQAYWDAYVDWCARQPPAELPAW